MDQLPISVIVITRNAEETIEECLSCVERNNPAEIIVVDGESTDRTVEVARRYTPRICSDGGRGKGFARQLGAEQATQQYVVYIDADVFVAEGALSTLLTEFRGRGYITMHALGEPRPQGQKWTYWEWAQSQHAQLSWALSRHQTRVGTAAGIFRRETILKYGFEGGYGGGLDDMDLEDRLRMDEHRLGISSARVCFYYKASMISLIKTRFLWGRVAVGYLRKYGLWHARFWPALRSLFWLGFCLIKGKPRLVPYFLLDGIVETAGMAKGLLDWVAEALRRRRRGNGA